MSDKIPASAKLGVAAAALIVLAIIGLLLFRIIFVNFVDNYELGYIFDSRTGQIQVLDRTGYVVTMPFMQSVHTVDLRPMQVCMNANARVMNCKLVKFNPDGLDTLLAWHGRQNYDGGNSNNAREGGSGGNLAEILKSYAFENKGKNYPFLIIISELENSSEVPDASNPPTR